MNIKIYIDQNVFTLTRFLKSHAVVVCWLIFVLHFYFLSLLSFICPLVKLQVQSSLSRFFCPPHSPVFPSPPSLSCRTNNCSGDCNSSIPTLNILDYLPLHYNSSGSHCYRELYLCRFIYLPLSSIIAENLKLYLWKVQVFTKKLKNFENYLGQSNYNKWLCS